MIFFNSVRPWKYSFVRAIQSDTVRCEIIVARNPKTRTIDKRRRPFEPCESAEIVQEDAEKRRLTIVRLPYRTVYCKIIVKYFVTKPSAGGMRKSMSVGVLLTELVNY